MATFAGLVYISKPAKPAQPRTYPRDGLLAELGGAVGTAVSGGNVRTARGGLHLTRAVRTSPHKAPAEGSFDKQESEEEEGEEEE